MGASEVGATMDLLTLSKQYGPFFVLLVAILVVYIKSNKDILKMVMDITKEDNKTKGDTAQVLSDLKHEMKECALIAKNQSDQIENKVNSVQQVVGELNRVANQMSMIVAMRAGVPVVPPPQEPVINTTEGSGD